MSLWSTTDKPKYLSTAEKALTIGVSNDEAQLAANKAKGVQHPGWVRNVTYTDAQGRTRNKTETLVAMGTIPSDGNTAITDDLLGGTLTTVTLTSTSDYMSGSSATRNGTAISIIGRPASTEIAKLLLLQAGDTLSMTTNLGGPVTVTVATPFATSDAGGGYLYYNATSVESVAFSMIEGDIVFDVVVP